MSQAGIVNRAGGPLPPDVPTVFETDEPLGNNEAIPVNNRLIVTGGYTSDDNDNGIQTFANPTGSMDINNLRIEITNRLFGTGQSTDGSTITLYSFPLGNTAGVYLFETNALGYNVTDQRAATFKSFRAIRTTGGVSPVITVISANTSFDGQDDDFSPNDQELTATLQLQVVGNSLDATASGVVGKTYRWLVRTIYDFRS